MITITVVVIICDFDDGNFGGGGKPSNISRSSSQRI